MINTEVIAEKIYNIRQDLNLTQSEFGHMLGSSFQSVCAWEKGRNIPDLATILKIIDVAGITADEFFYGVSKIAEDTDAEIRVSCDERRCICKLRAMPAKKRQAYEAILLDS